MTSVARPGAYRVLGLTAALAIVLAIDVRTDLPGQVLIGAAMWTLMLALLARTAAAERHVLVTCLLLATAGELLFSLACGLYTYRLGNVPMFVPPGHVLLFMLGIALAQRITDRAANTVIGCAALYAAAAAFAGFDTFGILLALVIAAAWLASPRHRRLYAASFALSLVLELYGTWLGVWRWAPVVPGLPLVTTNPPGTVGAFYCALDALVMTATLVVVPSLRRGYAAVKAA